MARDTSPKGIKKHQRYMRRKLIRQNWDLYLLVAIPVLSLIIFNYIPMFGIVIAFQDYKVFKGIAGSKWVGLAQFTKLFTSAKFFELLRNTILINVYKFVYQFPIPIILALLLNEVRVSWLKRGTQTLIYLPHFLSWVVVYGIFYDLLGTDGLINQLIVALGGTAQNFLANSKYFRSLLVVSTAWKESSWSTIVYLSAMTAIDPQLYEAAAVDGAGRLRQTWSITLPCIINTITFIIIMRASSIMGSDTEQVMMFYSPIVYGVGDVLGTFVYREGIENAKFSYTTAVGLFGSVVGMIMMLGANYVSRKYTDKGIW